MKHRHQKLTLFFLVFSFVLPFLFGTFKAANLFGIQDVKANLANEFSDDFDNLNSWDVKKGVWLIEEGTLKANGTGSNRWIYLKTFNATNFELEVKLKFVGVSGTKWFGVIVRMLDSSTYLWAFLYRDFSGGFSRLYLRYVKDGSLIKNLYTNNLSQNFSSNSWYTLKLSVIGAHVKFYVSEVSSAMLEEDMVVSAYTGFGLMVTGGEGEFYFDNLITSHSLTQSFELAKKALHFLVDIAMINNMSDTNYGGIRGMLKSDGTWTEPLGYTETTGYIITSLVNLYKFTGNASYLRTVMAASEWEINIAQYYGQNTNGHGGIRSTHPNATTLSSWHTSTVMAGLAEGWKLSRDGTYLRRMEAGMDFIIRTNHNQHQISTAGLVGTYNLLGKWFGADYLAASAGGQAHFILSVHEVIRNETYLEYARKNSDVLVDSQLANGTWWRFIYNNGTTLPITYSGQQIENYAHYIMYIAQGMLHGAHVC